MKYVLLRTGKVEVIGPFRSIEAAAKHVGEHGLLGYQVLPMKSPDPEADKSLPVHQQTREVFVEWSTQYPWPARGNDDVTIGEFLVDAEKKFPEFFRLHWLDKISNWGMDHQYKIAVIVGLRKFFFENGAPIDLRPAKDAVDDYEQMKREAQK